ncbi:GNAT family N-acetyltransferase [Deinococcus cavernae]|uniref:GNAT family N-acetyltransferase n=1 Tax=Deinococcus cavernae TaxID=2320857 RepID=A0A418V874_9DEIO|nr:GNAT family N-acetyltransferase [Deinococcus cavernae]RJF72290.1 GNAT family N-acetyltransferase [Deinococcus cavernae]
MKVRPFQHADAQEVARLLTESVRGQWVYGAEQFRESEDPHRRRLVAVQNGELLATARLSPFGEGTPDALRLDLAGDRRLFTPLFLALLADLPAGFTRLLGVAREDFSEQMAFFHAAGFRNAWQSWGAHLNLRGFDFERFRALDEQLFLQGYEVERWDNEAPESEWAALYQLHRQGEGAMPRNPTTTPDHLDLKVLRSMIQREERAFVVRHKQEIVALTRLTLGDRKGRGPEVESEFTATHPAHRSRGLATLLKAHALHWAKNSGYTHAGTGGTVLNLPMLRVNTRLGYLAEPMWVTWERWLGERRLDENPLP